MPLRLKSSRRLARHLLSLSRVSLPSFYLSISTRHQSIYLQLCPTELYGHGNRVRPFFIPQSSLNQAVRVSTSSRSSSNLRLHTPAGRSSHVVRLTVPQSCSADGGHVLVHVLGGDPKRCVLLVACASGQVRPGDCRCVAFFSSFWLGH